MEFRNELRDDCYWCHGKLTPHLSETVIAKCGDKEIVLKIQDLNVKNAIFIILLNLSRNKKPKYFKSI